MEKNKLIGLLCCVGLIFIGFAFQGNLMLYFNLAALLIVIGGTANARPK